MAPQFARRERPLDADDRLVDGPNDGTDRRSDDGRTAVDVSDVSADRVTESVAEWFPDEREVHLERKGGKTLLVAGE
jgi:hypothetical protein